MDQNNYFAMLDDEVETEVGDGGQRAAETTGQDPSAERRSGIHQRLSPNTRQILAARAARTATFRAANETSPSYRDVLAALR